MDKPYASLAKAVAESPDGGTVVVLSDLTADRCARFYNKSITIRSAEGKRYTVTRGDDFASQNDPARSWYNPAMIEVAGTVEPNAVDAPPKAYLRIEDLILDDGGRHSGKKLGYAVIDDGSGTADRSKNLEFVQDAIIASYNGTGVITLGDGAILRNFGGMSAVRVTGGGTAATGSTLIMEKGSCIEDTLTAEEFGERAKPLHRGNAAVVLQGANVVMEEGSVIRNLVLSAKGIQGSARSSIQMGGEITGLSSGGNAINTGGDVQCVIAATGNIHHNTVWYGTVYMQGGTLDIYGKINDNYSTDRAGGVCLAHNIGYTVATLHTGGEICGNYAKQTGGGVMVSYGSFTMEEGSRIDNNAAHDEGGGVYVRNGGTFIMNGGSVSGNKTEKFGGGIAYKATAWGGGAKPLAHANVVLHGGTVSGNRMFCTPAGNSPAELLGGAENELAIDATKGSCSYRNLSIDRTLSYDVYFVTDEKTLSRTDEFSKGNATKEADSALRQSAAGWADVLQTMWYNVPGDTAAFRLSLPKNADPALPFYVMTLATDEDGKPVSAAPTVSAVQPADGKLPLELPAAEYGCALAIVQPKADYGTLTLEGSPEVLVRAKDAESYEIVYTARLTLSDSTLMMLKESGLASAANALSLRCDARFGSIEMIEGSFQSDLFTAAGTKNENGVFSVLLDIPAVCDFTGANTTVQFRAVLPQDRFEANSALLTTAQLYLAVPASDTEITPVLLFSDTVRTPMRNLCTVTWLDGDGNTINAESYAEGAVPAYDVAVYGTPRKTAPEGKKAVFTGWTPAIAAVFEDTTYRATFSDEDISYTIVYRDGADNAAFPEVTFTARYGDPTPEFPGTPARSGYVFVRWEPLVERLVSGSRVYTAVWKEAEFIRPALGSAILTKVDAADPAVVLPGAVFELHQVYASGRDVLRGTFTTDTKGQIAVYADPSHQTGLAPTSHYYWLEIAAPAGYTLDGTRHEFTVRYGTTTKITVANTRSGVPSACTGDHIAYIVGYPDALVRPEAAVTRAEAATIFFRLLSDETRALYEAETSSFSDVSPGDWFSRAVSTLEALGVMNGYEDGTFRPDAPVTRAEFAAIAARFDTNGNETGASFADIYGHWGQREIELAAANGWLLGYEDGTFRPDSTITRAEAITIVNRVLRRVPETADDLLPAMTAWQDNADPDAWYYLAIQEATNSHEFARRESGYEFWLSLLPCRDWTEPET